MPDQHCPTCGTARSTGCGCVPDPSLTETAVLPHLGGPLVRPYVPQTADQVADGTHPNAPVVDPFATTVLPPAPPGRPGPPAAPPLGPDADAYATTVLPPVAPGQDPFGVAAGAHAGAGGYPGADTYPEVDGYAATTVLPPVPPGPGPHPHAPASGPAGNEIGLFSFGQAPDAGPASNTGRAPGAPGPEAGGGRAARRAAEQSDRRPLAQRKGLLAGVGAALVALTIGVAYAVTPSGEPPAKRAQPLPTSTLVPAPVDPPTLAAPAPSTAAPTSQAPSPTPTPTRRPSPTKTAAPAPTATPTAEAPAAPPVPTPTPTAPAPSTPAPAPSPTATPTPRVLQYGMSGPDVTALQQKLAVVVCWASVPVTGLYDDTTVNTVSYVQWMWDVKGDKRGIFGPNTRAALDKHNTC
ncbi:peptidoglycan-binding domain-containing protein [Kitasatospora sp. NPDC005856]|uniref:peptidoglycan-binding domain-containing protein n=1 Tax=Kitasatospora sp. NPDC005856 TaxID=3154566 RepID=UPI00340C6E7F